jgi:hypothetical protein
MPRTEDIAILKRLLAYAETGTTAVAAAPWRNDVTIYTAPERLAKEQDLLLRRHPQFIGFGSDWAKPGDWRTDDLSGVPLLIVRGRDGALRSSPTPSSRSRATMWNGSASIPWRTGSTAR